MVNKKTAARGKNQESFMSIKSSGRGGFDAGGDAS
jgi:hypothetical protein